MFISKIRAAFGIFLMCVGSSVYAQNFKVVLDPGHGAQDFGAVRGNYVEKKIVLDVALKVGELLKKDKNIDVVFTRKTDVFLEVRERTEIANKENADVFISIHANAVANAPSAAGTETFIMGISKNASNLEVAKRENAVITLEDNYETHYAGYDPSRPESLIGLTLVQEQFISQSIDLASKIQTRFTNDAQRKNRGVKQGPFWVLHSAFMPSILIELGFVSNKEEGAYLTSEAGKNELARAIANAIIDYKKQFHTASSNIPAAKKEKPVEPVKEQPVESAKKSSVDASKPEVITKEGIVFRVQIAASGKVLELKPANFNGLDNITSIKEDKLYKYFYNETTDYDHARKALEVAKNKGYTSAFLVAYKDGKKISIQEALK
ncbi:MAG TPA: N-acetylmuramoyl-L-alanine amidase [Flavobacterium sp.]|nr:N-acetylmuramoyl-L-alanine amidase [Flavobacterium sp.]